MTINFNNSRFILPLKNHKLSIKKLNPFVAKIKEWLNRNLNFLFPTNFGAVKVIINDKEFIYLDKTSLVKQFGGNEKLKNNRELLTKILNKFKAVKDADNIFTFDLKTAKETIVQQEMTEAEFEKSKKEVSENFRLISFDDHYLIKPKRSAEKSEITLVEFISKFSGIQATPLKYLVAGISLEIPNCDEIHIIKMQNKLLIYGIGENLGLESIFGNICALPEGQVADCENITYKNNNLIIPLI